MATIPSPQGMLMLQTSGLNLHDLMHRHPEMALGSYDLALEESPVDSLLDSTLFDENDDFDSQVSNLKPTDSTVSAQSCSPSQFVSPQDVLLDTYSAPTSSVMTNLSTPGTYLGDSPFINTSANPSPLFEQDYFGDDTSTWAPLFPTEGDTSSGAVLASNPFAFESMEVAAPPMSRNQSSGQSSRGSHPGRHSSSTGVNARKRSNPLPPITVDDPSDSVAVKRARNTAAARKSRARKLEKMEEMAETIERLTAERDHWKGLALSRQPDT